MFITHTHYLIHYGTGLLLIYLMKLKYGYVILEVLSQREDEYTVVTDHNTFR